MDTEKLKRIQAAHESVVSWFNPHRLVEVTKPLNLLIEDAYIIKKFKLSRIKDPIARESKWVDMGRIFRYRFGRTLE